VKVELKRADGSVFEANVRRQIYSEAPQVTTMYFRRQCLHTVRRISTSHHREFRAALQKFRGAPGLIVDLRRNGGATGVLLPIAGYFFGRRRCSPRTRRGLENRFRPMWDCLSCRCNFMWVVRGTDLFRAGVILVDAHSASSSEVFAAGMQDTLRARVIGSQSAAACWASPSRGDEGRRRAGNERSAVFSPKGRKLEGTGIIPDQLVTRRCSIATRARCVLAAADKSLVKAAVLESKETGNRNGSEPR